MDASAVIPLRTVPFADSVDPQALGRGVFDRQVLQPDVVAVDGHGAPAGARQVEVRSIARRRRVIEEVDIELVVRRVVPRRPGLGLDVVDRAPRGVQGRKPEVEASTRGCGKRWPPVFDQDRPPVGDRGPLGGERRELRRFIPIELIGVLPARYQCPGRRGRLDACAGDAHAVFTDELDRVAGSAAAREVQRPLRVDAVGAALEEHGAARGHALASGERRRTHQVARLLLGALAGGAAVRRDEVRVGDGPQQKRHEQADTADEDDERSLHRMNPLWKVTSLVEIRRLC